MVLGLDTVFNSSGEVGSWISASTTNVTGSLFLTVLVMFALLILAMLLFRMPELLIGVILAPLTILLITVEGLDQSMKLILGIIILVVALGAYAFYPSK